MIIAIAARIIFIVLISNSRFSFSLIVYINFIKIYIELIRVNANKSTIKINRYILTDPIFWSTDEENVIPPTKARTMAANMPNIVIYSFSIPFSSNCNRSFVVSILSETILSVFSI